MKKTPAEEPAEGEDTTAADEAEAQAAFAEGFDEKPDAAAVEGKAEEKAEAPPAEPTTQDAGAKVEAEPENVSLTKAELEELRAASKRAGDLEKKIAKLEGKTGDLQAKQKRNEPVASGDGETVTRKELLAREIEDLEDAHENWREIVGLTEEGGKPKVDQEKPYRKWLLTQPKAYQDKINNSTSARQIARSIDQFLASTEKPKAAAPGTANRTVSKEAASRTRRDRIANAVPIKSAGGSPPARTKTDHDEFLDGFANG